MRITRMILGILLLSVVAGTEVGAHRERYSPEPEMTGAQDAYLEQRIRSVEQRLYSIQSSLSRLEQQINIAQRPAPSPAPSQGARSPELDLLKSEVEILRARVRELECGVAHLDERTLSEGAKVGRKSAGARAVDPCRLNPETPVQNPRHP
jgi:chromosome segregation ATPase